ncbi:MAG TPA: UDP-N-acetylmuramate--L-alanine ligase [Saprospiraceae bacterium]|nr:UDP-N-acetylmuramate--L-alanine ligase [Saprospiraceae bacterium]
MNPGELTSVYFIGIGGIGMSAIARYFNTRGVAVAGYDKTETALTQQLNAEGIRVYYTEDLDVLPENIDLVVYTPAVPSDHQQLVHLLNLGVPVMKRAQVLGLISQAQKTIAIAGTHGKTTTSSMVTHVLKSCDESVSAFLGGILSGYNTNYFLGDSDWVVVEADEFDRSFLHLQPEIAVVNSIDPDHLDIYGTPDKVTEAYLAFIHKTRENGTVLLAHQAAQDLGAEEVAAIKNKYRVLTYGFEETDDIQLNIKGVQEGKVVFDFFSPMGSIESIASRMPGIHNVSNAAVAIAVALLLGKDKDAIANGVASFKGVKRRFEWIVDGEKVYIDDYAHHPTELKMAIGAARMMFPGKKLMGIFQPHLFTRTRDFADGFAEELSKLDELLLMDIYPAREEPIEGVDADMLLSRMNHANARIVSREEILDAVQKGNFDVVMTLGAGNIDTLVPQIQKILTGHHG